MISPAGPALVTGGSHDIGRACALALAAQACGVAISYVDGGFTLAG